MARARHCRFHSKLRPRVPDRTVRHADVMTIERVRCRRQPLTQSVGIFMDPGDHEHPDASRLPAISARDSPPAARVRRVRACSEVEEEQRDQDAAIRQRGVETLVVHVPARCLFGEAGDAEQIATQR